MTGKELFANMRRGDIPSRIPFVPSIYEHAARVVNKTPAVVAVDEDLIVESQLASYELYRHDLISVGIDIYNIECEALGARVVFPDNDEVPYLKETLLDKSKELGRLRLPDPEKDGRMPLLINAARRINEILGKEVIVNGTIVGPFTLAALIRGFENLILDMLEDPEFANSLMEFAKQVSLTYAKAYINNGIGLSINESWISPPLLSPTLYRKYVFPVEKEMIRDIKKMGLNNVAIISGGDTTEIANSMVKTGSTLLIADYNTDQEYYKKLCEKKDIFLRANIESKLLESGTEEELNKAVSEVMKKCSDYNRFIFGCGVVSYNTPTAQILLLKKLVKDYEYICRRKS